MPRVKKYRIIIKSRFIGAFIAARHNIPLSRGNVSEADKGVAYRVKIRRFSVGATPERLRRSAPFKGGF